MAKPTVAVLAAEIAALRGALHSAEQRIRVLERELKSAQRPAPRAARTAQRPEYAGLTRAQIAIREHRRQAERTCHCRGRGCGSADCSGIPL